MQTTRNASSENFLSLLNGSVKSDPAPQVQLPPARASVKVSKSEIPVADGAGHQDPLVAENKMLRNEIAALEDEVASFASRIRAGQDALSESKESLQSARQQLAEANAARGKLTAETGKLRDSLASKEKEQARAQAQVSSLQEQLRIATEQREAMLADHVRAGDAQTRALESLRLELEAAKGSSRSHDHQTMAVRQEHEEQVSKLDAALKEKERTIRELEANMEQNRGTIV